MNAVSAASPAATLDAPRLRPMLDERFGWRRHAVGALTLWFKGYEQTRGGAALALEAAALGGRPDTLAAWLASLDGFFALVVEAPGWSLAAVDAVRSVPLIHARAGGEVLVTQDGPALARALGLTAADVNPDGAAALALAGFTIGADTLYRGVRQLLPGEYLVLRGGAVEIGRYRTWRPWAPSAAEPEDLVQPLSILHERLIEKLIASAGDREILVPLSAGLDSRMILSGLVAAGYRRVRAFAYGLAGNREAVVSRQVAARLGVPWTFVPYTSRRVRAVDATEQHRQYLAYADSLTAIPFPQDYPALTAMLAEHGVGHEAILVNGQSGDFITGNHVPEVLWQPATGAGPEARRERVIEALIAKHFKQWGSLRRPSHLEPVRRRLAEEIAAIGGMPADPRGDHGIYEHCEFIDRQSKYVINGQRCYEVLGLDWRLPLWDREYLDFWQAAPLAAKRGQALYRRVLERDDWGSVWRDIAINPLRVRPAWLAPLRLAAKALHLPLGRARWHRFERRYLTYWMAPLCSFAPWPYPRVALDRRDAASAIGWHIERYLDGKGLAWDGRARDA